jgi:hypothetical protein
LSVRHATQEAPPPPEPLLPPLLPTPLPPSIHAPLSVVAAPEQASAAGTTSAHARAMRGTAGRTDARGLVATLADSHSEALLAT